MSDEYTPPRVPRGLGGTKGADLWRSVVEMYELSPVELELLESACRTQALIEELEAGLVGQPLTVPGANRSVAAHPLFAEIAKQKGLLLRQIGALKLPKDDDSEVGDVIDIGAPRRPMTRTESAKKAANARWSNRYGTTA